MEFLDMVVTIDKDKVKQLTEEVEKESKRVLINIGNLVRTYREKDNVSLRELSRRSGVCIASVCELESGGKLPHIPILLKIAFALGIPLTEILNENLI